MIYRKLMQIQPSISALFPSKKAQKPSKNVQKLPIFTRVCSISKCSDFSLRRARLLLPFLRQTIFSKFPCDPKKIKVAPGCSENNRTLACKAPSLPLGEIPRRGERDSAHALSPACLIPQVIQYENLNPLSQNPVTLPSKAIQKTASEGSKSAIAMCPKTPGALIGFNPLTINNIMPVNHEITVFPLSQNPLYFGTITSHTVSKHL
jgi:hypothetical protein